MVGEWTTMAKTLSRGLTGRRVPRWLAGTTAAAVVLLGMPLVSIAPASAVTVGGFEVDGNSAVNTAGNEDWKLLDPLPVAKVSGDRSFRNVATVLDNTVGGQDDTLLGSNDKEDSPPWTQQTSGNVTGKSDFGRMGVYTYTRPVGGVDHVYLVLGFDRGSNSGGNATAGYWFELNQVKQVGQNPNPIRTAGDVKFLLQDQGSGNFSPPGFFKWVVVNNVGSWVVGAPPNPVYAAASNSTSNGGAFASTTLPSWWLPTPNVASGQMATEAFIEASIDLTSFGAVPGCPSRGFAALNSRSTTGNGDNNLQDYVEAIGLSVPSDCAALRIEKYAGSVGANNKLGGATFAISPDPRPTGTGITPCVSDGATANPAGILVKDNGACDTDPAAGVVLVAPAKPGTYTVTESSPPPGYIGSAASFQYIAARFDSNPTTTIAQFVNNLGTATWRKTDAGSNGVYDADDALLGGATFTMTATAGAANGAPWNLGTNPITVVDNTGQAGYTGRDTNAAAGQFTVTGLPTGTYTVHETAVPVGYGPSALDGTVLISTTAATPVVVTGQGSTFSDPRLKGWLGVIKNAGGEVRGGATFTLYKIVGAKDAPGGETNDVAVGTCVTADSNGTCFVPALNLPGLVEWGVDYYWYETLPPPNYNVSIPAERFGPTINLTAAQVAAQNPTVPSSISKSTFNNVPTLVTTKAQGLTGGHTLNLPTITQLFDTAEISGVTDPNPADQLSVGSMTFYLYKVTGADPGESLSCTVTTVGAQGGPIFASSPYTVTGSGPVAMTEASGYLPTSAGTYYWFAKFTSNYPTLVRSAEDSCGSLNERVVVNPASPGIKTIATTTAKLGLNGVSISDTVTLSGLTSNATGTVKVWLSAADGTCNVDGTPVKTVMLGTPPDGTIQSSNGVYFVEFTASATVTSAGLYKWQASYTSGDTNNISVTHACGDMVAPNKEQTLVTPATPAITTDTKTPANQDVKLPGTNVADSATLTGLTANATGTVVFKLYGAADTTCSAAAIFTSTKPIGTVTGGTATVTSDYYDGIINAGTYRWAAVYNGDLADKNNAKADHPCGSTTGGNYEIVTIEKADNSIITTAGADTTLGIGSAGATITDQVVVSGLTPNATGKVTVSVYGPVIGDNFQCTTPADTVDEFTVTGNVVNGTFTATASAKVTQAGTYWWLANYSGDVNNNGISHLCGLLGNGSDERVVVDKNQPIIATKVDKTTLALPVNGG